MLDSRLAQTSGSNDGYFAPSPRGYGTSFVLDLQSESGNLEATLTAPVAGATVDSINLPSYAGFGLLPTSANRWGFPLVDPSTHNLACVLEYSASGGHWRAADWTDLRNYLDRGGDFNTIRAFLVTQAALETISGRLCREELFRDGDVYQDRLSISGGWLGPEMRVVPAGTFTMGSASITDDESVTSAQPVREVTIEHDFAIGVHEVTQADYGRFARATGRTLLDDADWGRGARPAINVSWDDAVAYAEWLSSETGKIYRLPTEAEWEYAARAGTTTVYPWGDDYEEDKANCDGCGSDWDNEKTAPVGRFDANAWGLLDMHGNVREWVQDCWVAGYDDASTNGSARTTDDCVERVQPRRFVERCAGASGFRVQELGEQRRGCRHGGIPSGSGVDDVSWRSERFRGWSGCRVGARSEFDTGTRDEVIRTTLHRRLRADAIR